MQVPFKNSYWVIDNKLLAGCVPTNFLFKKYEKIDCLLKFGIATIIDLRDDSFDSNFLNYKNFILTNNQNIEIINFKIKDFTCPSKELITQILNTIDAEIIKDRKIYIHCLGGIGRTGTIVACYLLRHKITNKQNILKYIEDLRKHSNCKKIKSPETKEQIEMVVNWKD